MWGRERELAFGISRSYCCRTFFSIGFFLWEENHLMEFVFGWVILRLTKFKAKLDDDVKFNQLFFRLPTFHVWKQKIHFREVSRPFLGGLFLLPCRVVSKPQFPFSRPNKTSKNHGAAAITQHRKGAAYILCMLFKIGKRPFSLHLPSSSPAIHIFET